jgi:hypothetical protein
VQRLVERVAVRVQALREHVDRHAVQGERDEHAALMRGQHLGDRLLERGEQLALLGLVARLESRAREQAPRLGLERHLTPLPRTLT